MRHTEISCAESAQTTFLCAPYGFSMRVWRNGAAHIDPCGHRLRLPYLEVVSCQSKYGPPLSQYFQLSLRNESCENLLFRNSFYFLFSSTTMYFITTGDCLGIVAKIWTAENHMIGSF